MKQPSEKYSKKIEYLKNIGESIVDIIIVHGCLTDKKAIDMFNKKYCTTGDKKWTNS